MTPRPKKKSSSSRTKNSNEQSSQASASGVPEATTLTAMELSNSTVWVALENVLVTESSVEPAPRLWLRWEGFLLPDNDTDIVVQERLHLAEMLEECVELHKPFRCPGLKFGGWCNDCNRLYSGNGSYGENLKFKIETWHAIDTGTEVKVDEGFDPSAYDPDEDADPKAFSQPWR